MEKMNLRTYLANIKMTIIDFSKIIDCDSAYLSRIIHEKVIPGHRLAKDIERATSGQVKIKIKEKKKK